MKIGDIIKKTTIKNVPHAMGLVISMSKQHILVLRLSDGKLKNWRKQIRDMEVWSEGRRFS